MSAPLYALKAMRDAEHEARYAEFARLMDEAARRYHQRCRMVPVRPLFRPHTGQPRKRGDILIPTAQPR